MTQHAATNRQQSRDEAMDIYMRVMADGIAYNRGKGPGHSYTAEGFIADHRAGLIGTAEPVMFRGVEQYPLSDDDLRAAFSQAERLVTRIISAFEQGQTERESTREGQA